MAIRFIEDAGRLDISFHRGANRLTHRNARRVELIQTEDIDAQVVGRDSLPMERVDAAPLAEEVTRRHGVESVLGEPALAGYQPELTLMDLHHQRVPAATDRAVTGSQLRKIGFDLELDRAAMAAAAVFANWPTCHGTGAMA
jgi:hypothetical protein